MKQGILWASLLVSGLLAAPAASQAVSSVSAASARLPVAQGMTKFTEVCLGAFLQSPGGNNFAFVNDQGECCRAGRQASFLRQQGTVAQNSKPGCSVQGISKWAAPLSTQQSGTSKPMNELHQNPAKWRLHCILSPRLPACTCVLPSVLHLHPRKGSTVLCCLAGGRWLSLEQVTDEVAAALCVCT